MALIEALAIAMENEDYETIKNILDTMEKEDK